VTNADNLSRRERQLIDALYTMGEGSARDISQSLGEPEAYDSIRVTLGLLERRGHLKHRVNGRQHVYSPVQPRSEASRSAWRRLTRTFFGGSPGRALISFLDASGERLGDEDLDELAKWVREQQRRKR
jgi:predicted transcriptional regulator